MLDRTVDRSEELGLLHSVLAGDGQASARFFQRYKSTVELGVRQVLRRASAQASSDDVEDLVHEIWLALFEHDKRCLRRFEPRRDIKVATWIGLLARHKTIDRLRCAGAHARLVRLGDDGQLPDGPSDAPLPTEQLELREREALAQRAFDRLREDERRFLEAWYLDERDPEQLAAELGVALGTVYTRRFKLQEKLAKNIGRLSRPRPSRPAHTKTTQRRPLTHSSRRHIAA